MRKLSPLILLILTGIYGLNAQPASSKIFEAVKANDLREVKSLLDQGADPNAVDEDGDNLLMIATFYSSLECMQLLIEKGANVNAKNKIEETALIWSVHDLEKTKLLIQRGADINTKAKSGNTPLLIAAVGADRYEILRFLLDNGADAFAVNNKKENALMRASLFGDVPTVSLLLNKGHDVNAYSLDSSTALMNAVLNFNKPVIFQLLDKGADPDKICFFGLTPLATAAIFTDAEVVKAILKKTKNVNTVDYGGTSVLMFAGYNEYDDVEMMQALLDKGADVNLKSKDGSTALSWAMKKGNSAKVELLKKSGAR